MFPTEKGVLFGSNIYFHTGSELARELFFYPLCTGLFCCDKTYEVARHSYDSFLVLYVEDGSGYVVSAGEEIPVSKGSFVMLDCYRPHRYGTRSGWKIYWLHFDGVLARRYAELCTRSGPVLRADSQWTCRLQLQKIFGMFHEGNRISEPEISRRITCLLTELMQFSLRAGSRPRAESAVDETLSFIAEHVTDAITLEDMAKNAALSPYYFSRLFKEETGHSPHEYLILFRVDKAKYLLTSTDMPLKEIAFSCGFSSECKFSSTFKKVSGYTPLSYRNQSSAGHISR